MIKKLVYSTLAIITIVPCFYFIPKLVETLLSRLKNPELTLLNSGTILMIFICLMAIFWAICGLVQVYKIDAKFTKVKSKNQKIESDK